MTSSKKKRLTPKQLRALDLMMSDMTTHEVAEAVGVTRQTISLWKNHDQAFQDLYAQLIADVEEGIRRSAPLREAHMLSQLMKLASEGPHETRLKSVLAYLDRHGSTALQPQNTPRLNEDDQLLLSVMQRRRTEQEEANRHGTERLQ